MDELKKYHEKVKMPGGSAKIYKDECVFSFETPETPTGLYVNLTTFLGYGYDYVAKYFADVEIAIFLHIKRTKHEIPAEQTDDGPDKKITRLAIGTPGGFNPDSQKYTYEEKYSIVAMPGFKTVPYPNNDLPKKIKKCVESVLKAESAFKIAEKAAIIGTWDGETRRTTKHINLLQLDNNGKKIPPSGWKCENCELTTNLWLNLTDGSILCGRKFYDGTGGNNHALAHYKKHQYPLAVKLGTITRDGRGDVYSYDEDDMVEDPNLANHLSHWGINCAFMEKTDKSMVELELELNQKFGEMIAMQEGNNQLTPLYGPGYTGLVNLGNSCYLNSVMQMCFSIPDFVSRFVNKADDIFKKNILLAPDDFPTQMAKLGIGLLSGKYSKPPTPDSTDENRQGISPRMFKTLVGCGHEEFVSNRQQDAQEFFLHIINLLERNSRYHVNPADCFKFKIEERYQCSSGKVKYTSKPEYLLPVPIPMDAVINKEEVAAYEAEKSKSGEDKNKFDLNVVRPRLELHSCLESFAKVETVEQFYSSALNEKTTATKTTRLASFPDYLLLHLKKFTVKEDWTPVKLDVAVEMPPFIDLKFLKSKGLQPDEELLPESDVEPPPPNYDMNLLSLLSDMGFPVEACKKALYFTQNSGLDSASQWLLEHIADEDFAQRFVPPGTERTAVEFDEFIPASEALECVMDMGFTKEQALKALQATGNNLERAVDWLFNHQFELDEMEDMDIERPPSNNYRDGPGAYRLVGFITHMGTSTVVGHYVCYLYKDDKWVLFNDEKVFLSEKPATELGYIYLYERLNKN